MNPLEKYLASVQSMVAKSNRKRTARIRAERRRRLRVEVLEDRLTLSTIHWVNRADGDGFDERFGDQAEAARAVVDAAIDAWEEIIINFNYAGDEDDNRYDLTVQTTGQPWVGRAFQTDWDASGKPTEGILAVGGAGHYISTPHSSQIYHEEFTAFVDRFSADATDIVGFDFYTTLVHELGHLVGLTIDESLAIYEFLTDTGVEDPTGPGDPTTSIDNLWTLNVDGGPIDATFTGDGHLYHGPRTAETGAIPTHPNDLMNTGEALPANRRFLISDTDASVLRQVYGYSVRTPSQVNTFHANFDPVTDTLTVKGTADPNTIRIQSDGNDLVVTVDDTRERFTPQELPGLNTVVIDAGGDNDEITLHGDIDSKFGFDVNVLGGSGNDTLRVNDHDAQEGSDVYTLTRSSLTKPSWDGSLEFSSISTFTLNTSDFDDEINVESTSYRLIVGGHEGSDTINIGNGDFGTNIAGDITVVGREVATDPDFDVVNILDGSDSGNDDYTVTRQTFSKSDSSRLLTWVETARVVLNANDGNNQIDVEELHAGAELVLNGNGGVNTYNIGDGNYFADIRDTITINGGPDNDHVVIDDTASASVLGSTESYKLDRELVDGTPYGNFVKGRIFPESPPQPEILSPELHFTAVENVTVDGSRAADQFYVNRALRGVHYDLRGNDRNDTFRVGVGDYDSRIFGDLSVFGGDGEDRVIVDDTGDAVFGSSDRYVFDSTGFTKETAFTVGDLAFEDVEDFELQGNDQGTAFEINTTVDGTDYTLYGNGGDDSFGVDAFALRSNLTIVGGDHDAGDTLEVRNGVEPGAVYEPNPYSADAGVIRELVNYWGTSRITFSGLEPLVIRNFPDITFRSPRSLDVLSIDPTTEGGIRVSGTSTHGLATLPPGIPQPPQPPLPLPTDFELLETYSVGQLIVDAGTNDPRPLPQHGGPYIYQPLLGVPDQITVNPGALSADNLSELVIQTGVNPSWIMDRTLEGSAATGQLSVQGRGAYVQVNVLGTAARADFESLQGAGSRLDVYDAANEPLHQLSTHVVQLVTMLQAPSHLNAIIEDGVLGVRASNGNQAISGGFTTLVTTPDPTGSRLEAALLGESSLRLGDVAFADFAIRGARPSTSGSHESSSTINEVTIAPVFSDPQPVPFASPIQVSGFGPNDELVFEAPTVDGALPTTEFSATFGESLASIEVPATSTAGLTFSVEMPANGISPLLALAGHEGLDNTGLIFSPGAADPDRAITHWRLGTLDLPTLDVSGGAFNDTFTFAPQFGAGWVGSVTPERPGAPPFELSITTDDRTTQLNLNGGEGSDASSIGYGLLRFSPPLTANPTSMESLHVAAAFIPARVEHTVNPIGGEIRAENLTLTHDAAVSETTLDGSDIITMVSGGQFHRDVIEKHMLAGTHSTMIFEDAEFFGSVVTVVEGNRAGNTVIKHEQDAIYHNSCDTIIETHDGNDQVLVTHQGVYTQIGGRTNIDLGKGEDFVVLTDSGSGQGVGVADDFFVTAEGDTLSTEETNVLLFHELRDVSAEEQLDDLKLDKPEYAAAIDSLKSAAETRLLQEQGTAKAVQGTTNLLYHATGNVEIFAKNADFDPVSLTANNLDGFTRLGTAGNVNVTVPVLVGTGIAAPEAFYTAAVRNTLDAGDGSLRSAITTANSVAGSEPAIVAFAIPVSDPGFHNREAFVIAPQSTLPALTRDNVVINGQSQQARTGDSNPLGPEIILDGSSVDNSGLRLFSRGNRVHGLGVHSFGGSGLIIRGDGNTITGNYLGTDSSGTEDLGNRGMGVFVIDAVGNTIQDNLISGNDVNGVVVAGALSTNNVVRDNRIGTDRTGTLAIGNTIGVHIADAAGNLVEGNLVSGNLVGIDVSGLSATGNQVVDNRVGTMADGMTPLGNRADGIFIDGAPGNAIMENVIAWNGFNGVIVGGDAAVGNTIRRNSIHSNTRLGIDLGGDGITANDDLDADTGPNNLQNTPNIRQARVTPQEIVIRGQLRSAPNSHYLVDFYASPEADAEGQRWLGSVIVMTKEDGVAPIRHELPLGTAVAGESITATATLLVDQDGDPGTPPVPCETSEFSLAAPLSQPGGANGNGNGNSGGNGNGNGNANGGGAGMLAGVVGGGEPGQPLGGSASLSDLPNATPDAADKTRIDADAALWDWLIGLDDEKANDHRSDVRQ